MAAKPLDSWEWKELRARVLREEPCCQLRLPRCTGVSTCVGHTIPLSVNPDLWNVRSNCRGSCESCNRRKGNRTDIPPQRLPKALRMFNVRGPAVLPKAGLYAEDGTKVSTAAALARTIVLDSDGKRLMPEDFAAQQDSR